MQHQDHHAILLGINYYPGLSDLEGPANDIYAFRRWLKDPAGGNVPANNIRVVLSSQFRRPVADVNDANPTERSFIKKLDKLMRSDDGTWKVDRVGERLYLYMAGHGFTAGSSISDPALFSAVARHGDTAHIAGYRYAAKIAHAGYFDEIVLIMDCCQDVLKASQVLEPTWNPPDLKRSAHVKMLQAYGAPRGKVAFESVHIDNRVRGIFSSVLLDALATARSEDGFVTGRTLKGQFLQLWGDRHKQRTGYEPPIRLPDGLDDIKLFPRAAPSALPTHIRVRAPVPHAAQLQVMTGVPTSIVVDTPAAESFTVALSPGFYKASLTGTARTRLFEVTGNESAEVVL